MDNLVLENSEESFLPKKIMVKYLFDNIYVVQFKLDEGSSNMLNSVNRYILPRDSSLAPSNSQGRILSDKVLATSSLEQIFVEEQKTPPLCPHERCRVQRTRLQLDLKRIVSRNHDYQMAVYKVGSKMALKVKNLGEELALIGK